MIRSAKLPLFLLTGKYDCEFCAYKRLINKLMPYTGLLRNHEKRINTDHIGIKQKKPRLQETIGTIYMICFTVQIILLRVLPLQLRVLQQVLQQEPPQQELQLLHSQQQP